MAYASYAVSGWRLAWDRTVALVEALAVHAGSAVVLFYGLSVTSTTIKPDFPVTIQAVVVDTAALLEAREQRKRAEQEILRQAATERREEQRRREAEAQRERDLAAQRQAEANAQSRRLADEKRRADELERQREEIRQKRLAAEEQRRQQEKEYLAAQTRREEQERQRQARLEEERRKQLLAFEDQQRLTAEQLTLQQEWIALIATMVRQNWRRPPTAAKGTRCLVQVDQLPGGDVISAAVVGGCNADEVTRRSVIDAVLRSEPLPYKGYEPVFRRQLKFEFVVHDE